MIGAHVTVDVQKAHEMSALTDTHTRELCADLLSALARGETRDRAPQRFHLRRAVGREERDECSWIPLLEMFGPLNPEQCHKQERQQRRAQTIESRADLTVELAADPQQPALDQARQSQQHAGSRNRGSITKQRCGILEQPEIGELPIEGSVARVAIEALGHRLIIVCGRGRGARTALSPWVVIIVIIAPGRRCRWRSRRRLFRWPDLRQRKLPTCRAPGRSDLFTNGFLSDAELMRDRPVAHPLALHLLYAAQTFRRDASATATPARFVTERRHPPLGIAPLVAPHRTHRTAKRTRNVRLQGKA